ncbi:MAG: glycosyltransferase family 2 protein [Pseudomonadota bacterium]
MGQDPDAMSVAVAIVNYGTAEMVIEALPALRRELAPLPRRVVFIVDNASPGDDAARLAEHLATSGPGGGPDPEIRLIASERNGGFAAGNNLAFAAIRGLDWTPDAVLMLNPDAEPRPGALREMLTVMAERPKAGFVGPRLERADGTIWSGAFRFPTIMSEFSAGTGLSALIRRWPVVLPVCETPTQVDWVTGAALLARWATINELSGMDEKYFLYFEEVDLMYCAKRKNWQAWNAPKATVLHDEGTATGMQAGKPREGPMPDYWFKSWRRYYEKNHGRSYLLSAAIFKLAGINLGILQRYVRGRNYDLPEGFQAALAAHTIFGGKNYE